jgi:hypothetical protein
MRLAEDMYVRLDDYVEFQRSDVKNLLLEVSAIPVPREYAVAGAFRLIADVQAPRTCGRRTAQRYDRLFAARQVTRTLFLTRPVAGYTNLRGSFRAGARRINETSFRSMMLLRRSRRAREAFDRLADGFERPAVVEGLTELIAADATTVVTASTAVVVAIDTERIATGAAATG